MWEERINKSFDSQVNFQENLYALIYNILLECCSISNDFDETAWYSFEFAFVDCAMVIYFVRLPDELCLSFLLI